MKRKLLLMLLCAALGLGAAQAEVYRVESEADVPADWAEKDTLRLTCIDTNRSDAMVLQSGWWTAAKGAIASACMRRWMDMASRN